MALGRLITYFLSSSTLVLLLLLLLPPSGCSQLVGAAAHHINVNGGNASATGTSPFICKTSYSVNSSTRTSTFSRKPFINPLVVTVATAALCGCWSIGVFWMLFAYLYLKSLNNPNASIAASDDDDEDDFNDKYGIMSRRRIRKQNQRAKSSACCCCAESGPVD